MANESNLSYCHVKACEYCGEADDKAKHEHEQAVDFARECPTVARRRNAGANNTNARRKKYNRLPSDLAFVLCAARRGERATFAEEQQERTKKRKKKKKKKKWKEEARSHQTQLYNRSSR